jgi:hypothetical protein
MPQVALIPTGAMEHAALAPALKRVFPGVSFVPRPSTRHLNGFTSRDVSQLVGASPGPIPTELDELAGELVNAVLPGRRGAAADFAFVIEDLELVNDHQPALVAQVFRDAVDRFIVDNWPSMQARTRAYDRVRECCSFHLFRPMTEAYFFADPAALQRAGAAQAHQLRDGNLEEFQTNDHQFSHLLPDTRPKNDRRIIDMPDRERHPKSYMHYLCDPTLVDRKSRYKETKGGADALRDLDWQQVLAAPPHCPFLHAFLDDLAEALNQRPTFVDATQASPATKCFAVQNRLLRNL